MLLSVAIGLETGGSVAFVVGSECSYSTIEVDAELPEVTFDDVSKG